MISELFIAFQIAATSTDVALVEDVISYREPYGEYLFYVAVDQKLGIDSANPKKVDDNSYALSYEVSVSFQPDVKQIALSEIADYSESQGDNFQLVEPLVAKKLPSSVKQLYANSGLSGVILPVESGENWASWAEFSWVSGKVTMSFVLKQVEGNRVKQIHAFSRTEDYNISDVYNHWNALVNDYKSIPMHQLSGANKK